MAKVFTTEITSATIESDNPIHQRLYKAYVVATEYVSGNLLEVGCGEGRGINLLKPLIRHYTAIDKIEGVIKDLETRHPEGTFIASDIPPFPIAEDERFDCVVSFQVIEHIRDDLSFLKEIHRMLKPSGIALITTPNRRMSLSRNPWHIREYVPGELHRLAAQVFREVTVKGITGNEKVMRYYEDNKSAVRRITRWDIFNLQYRLPAALLRIPYEILNRMNRNKLKKRNDKLVSGIHHEDYLVTDDAENALDLLLIVRK